MQSPCLPACLPSAPRGPVLSRRARWKRAHAPGSVTATSVASPTISIPTDGSRRCMAFSLLLALPPMKGADCPHVALQGAGPEGGRRDVAPQAHTLPLPGTVGLWPSLPGPAIP